MAIYKLGKNLIELPRCPITVPTLDVGRKLRVYLGSRELIQASFLNSSITISVRRCIAVNSVSPNLSEKKPASTNTLFEVLSETTMFRKKFFSKFIQSRHISVLFQASDQFISLYTNSTSGNCLKVRKVK